MSKDVRIIVSSVLSSFFPRPRAVEATKLGIGAGYFDGYGIIRDIMQQCSQGGSDCRVMLARSVGWQVSTLQRGAFFEPQL